MTGFEKLFKRTARCSVLLVEDYEALQNDMAEMLVDLFKTVSQKSIRKLVFKLRKKLPASSIESIYGMGYKLVPLR